MASLRDVAERAGVSVSAVSFVLNGTNLNCVSKEKQLRIKKAVKDLSYIPNVSARNLVRQKTRTITFVVGIGEDHGFGNPFYSSILEGVEMGCRSRGYTLVVSRQQLPKLDSYTIAKGVKGDGSEGLIATGPIPDEVVERLQDGDVKFVIAGNDIGTADAVSVTADEQPAYIKMLEYLKSLGHRHIGYSYHETCITEIWINKFKKYFELPQFKDMRYSFVSTGSKISDVPQGYEVGRRLLAMKDRPTALFCSDLACVGVCNCYRDAGLKIPEDLSVVAKLGTSVCEFYWPPLTTIQRDNVEIGRVAANILVDSIEKGSDLKAGVTKIPCSIKIRQSCCKLSD